MRSISAEVQQLVPNWKGNLSTTHGIESALKSVRDLKKQLSVEDQKQRDTLQKQLMALNEIEQTNKRIADTRAELGLRDGEKFDARPSLESAPEKEMIRQLEADIRHWEKVANDALADGNRAAAKPAMTTANRLAEDLQQYKNAVEAVKDAEKEQLDTMRDRLREQKEFNREKESELQRQLQIVNEIRREQEAQRVSSAASSTDTEQGMANNAISKAKERDEAMIGMSPNQDWQRIMKAQLDQYYNNVQAASDRFTLVRRTIS